MRAGEREDGLEGRRERGKSQVALESDKNDLEGLASSSSS